MNMAGTTLIKSILKSQLNKTSVLFVRQTSNATQAYRPIQRSKFATIIKGIQPFDRVNITNQSPDFKPALQCMPKNGMSYDSSNKVHQTIHNLIGNTKKRVFVFMKGTPSEPSCRYSAVVVQILDAHGVDYDSCDVLSNAEIRQELKSYSDWPTIPQVYMDGSFIGGCDILLQMYQSGELKQLFGDGTSPNSSDSQDKTQK